MLSAALKSFKYKYEIFVFLQRTGNSLNRKYVYLACTIIIMHSGQIAFSVSQIAIKKWHTKNERKDTA